HPVQGQELSVEMVSDAVENHVLTDRSPGTGPFAAVLPVAALVVAVLSVRYPPERASAPTAAKQTVQNVGVCVRVVVAAAARLALGEEGLSLLERRAVDDRLVVVPDNDPFRLRLAATAVRLGDSPLPHRVVLAIAVPAPGIVPS